MGWLVLSILGVLLVIELMALIGIRARKPTSPKTALDVRLPAPPDDSALGF